MVDFQSRDTHRGRDDEDADDSAGEPAADPDEAASEETEQDGDSAASEADDDRGFAVVTVAGDRSIEEDESGRAAVEAIEAAGDSVVTRELIDPHYDGVQKALDSLADRRDVYAVVTVGGTGVEPRDVTIEAIRPMLAKELPGFGELVRRQCYESVGTAVIRTRATAGILDGTVCFCLPGDADIVEPGVRDVVLREAEYIAALASRDDS